MLSSTFRRHAGTTASCIFSDRKRTRLTGGWRQFWSSPFFTCFSFLKEPGLIYPDFLAGLRDYIPYLAFLISIFSALRLANFNVDERQTSSFIGLPVPANALYWGALIVGGKDFLLAHCNVIYLIIMVMLFSWLLVAEIPMFSLKFKNLSWKDNKVSFIFLIVCIPLLLFLGISGFSAVIVWYIILSLLTRKINKQSFWHVCCTTNFKQCIKQIAHVSHFRIFIHYCHSRYNHRIGPCRQRIKSRFRTWKTLALVRFRS